MSNYSPSLQEFICPIPICQSGADLGNMLNIFQHLNCHNLAIPDEKGGWGVVYARDLLSLVTEAWLGDKISLISHPRNAISHQSMSRAVSGVDIMLETATTYQADLKLSEFLTHLKHDSAFWEREVCLILDRQGELLGQLDRNKLIAYLASESSLKTSLAVPFALTYLVSLIDEIALPSKIETALGQTIHANQQWQLLGQSSSQVFSQTFKAVKSDRDLDRMTKSWIASQKSVSSSDRNYVRDLALNWKQQLETKTSDINHLQSLFEIEREADWNYLKIPLTASERETPKRESYCLILAIPAIETNKSSGGNSTPTVDKSTTQILGAVSHELKSPLTGIVGLSNLLQGQQLGSLNQRQLEYVELIHRSGKKMMRTIENLLQLTALITEPSPEMELINLEFLCRQLYQAVLSKVELQDGDRNSAIFSQPKLRIEFGSEITIANESRLSSVLSNLMLEAFALSSNSEQLQIQISSGGNGTTAIAITSSQNLSLTDDLGLNFTIAKHLATVMGATVTSQTTANRRQLTLILPKGEIQSLPPVTTSESHLSTAPSQKINKLTILCLYPELEVIDPLANPNCDSNLDLKSFNDSCGLPAGCQHRLIEADSIEQAHNLARIWQIDAIIINGSQIARPTQYLRWLQEYEHLASLPLITLDTKTTEAANQIEGLNVFPCLLPSQCRSIEDLIQVIQIAIES